MTWSTAAKNRGLFLGAGILAVILGVFAYQNTQAVAETDQLQTRIFASQQVRDNTRISFSKVQATLSRYVTTGNPADLQRYNSARSRLLGDVVELAHQQNDESNQAVLLIPLVMVNVIWADGVVLLRSFGMATTASQISAGGLHRRIADQTTQVFDALRTDAIQTITQLAAQSGVRSYYAVLMTIVRTVVMIGLLGISYYFLERELHVHTQYEQQIKQLHENARLHAERLAQINKELEAFSYTISHDLRAPLRAIDGFSRIVMNEYAPDLPAEAQRHLERVRVNTQRMGALIDDLLQFARVSRQALNVERVDPAVLVNQILDDELRAERQARPVAIEIGALPPCKADPALLRQVYVNLLSNAFKFSSKREQPRIEIGAKREDSSIVYYVRDNGAGFDDQYIDKLFGVFQRLHRQEDFAGTGAGLAIVRRVINRHGGRVWAESGIDRGATFYFTLGDICE